MSAIITIDENAESPLFLNEVKKHLQIEDDDHDSDELIETLMDAAVDLTEHKTGRQLRPATIVQYQRQWRNCVEFSHYSTRFYPIRLEVIPFIGFTSIVYKDSLNADITLTDTFYEIDQSGLYPQVRFIGELPELYVRDDYNSYAHNTVAFTYRAGYTPENLPKAMRAAMLLMIGDWFENREDSRREMPLASDRLLSKYTIYTFY